MTCHTFASLSLSTSGILTKVLLMVGLISPVSHAFDAGEHALIGDTAFEQAQNQFAALQIDNNITNLEMSDVSYRYGQLVALSGDMYKSVEEISLSDAKLMNGFFRRNRESLKKCVAQEIHAIRHEQLYSGCDDVRLATKKIRYVTLAHDNFDHFAWHNIKKHIELHQQALWFANLAHLKCTKQQRKQNKTLCDKNKDKLNTLIAQPDYKNKLKSKYRKLPKLFPRKQFSKRYFRHLSKQKMTHLALFANSAADHYLSDAFSAGHLRVPRSQIDAFVSNYAKNANQNNKRFEGSAVSGALTQFLHNNDGSLTGIEVINSLNQKFVVRSDKQLFAALNSANMSGKVENNSQLAPPAAAVSQSLQEVFDVLKNGEQAMPKGVFTALNHVPYLASNKASNEATNEASNNTNNKAPSLSNNINALVKQKGSIKQAMKTMSKEMQLVFKSNMVLDDIDDEQYFADFIAQLPQLMKDLRQQIATESANDALKKRIPTKLLTALLRLE